MEEKKIRFIDLFAGVGGFHLALKNVGAHCVFSSELDKNAQITYQANYGIVPYGDITLIETKDVIEQNFEILCAGFPCQAFSVAGYKKGFEDKRGVLFFEIEKIAKKHRPKVLFLENVKNLAWHNKGKTFKTIKNIIEKKLRYKMFYKVLNTMEYANIPQNRERIFIVAFDPKQVPEYKKFEFPDKIELKTKIRDFLQEGKQQDCFYYHPKHKYYCELEKNVIKTGTTYQWRRVYVRENKSNVCPTLTANMGTGGHNVPIIKDDFGIRKLTPRECFNLQGYPKDFVLPPISIYNLYKQAGNSVTITLIERIAKEILKVL